MKKLFLLLDEWDNDKNFVGNELDIIRRKYDVTVICNSAEADLQEGVNYYIYKRPGKVNFILASLAFFFDKTAVLEGRRALKEDNGIKKLSETIRFYSNAVLFEKYLKKNRLLADDAIYYSYWNFWKCMAIAKNKNKLKGIKLISRIHGYDLYRFRLPSGYQPFKHLMDEAEDKLVFISDHGKNYYLGDNHFQDSDKYIISYLGTNNPYKYKEFDRTGVFTIVSVSSLIQLKRVDYIIEALAAIDDVEIRWIHFGDGPEREALQNMSKELLDVKDNIVYEFKGYTKNEDILEFYNLNKVDAFITTSSSEGMPVSIMEAMSFGIQIIASSVGNIPYMMCNNGVLISDNPTINEVCEAIRTVAGLTDEETMERRDNSRRAWENKYTANTNFNKFVCDVIDKL